MRIRWVVENGDQPGGVEAVVRLLNAEINKRGVDSAVLSWLPDTAGPPHERRPLRWLLAKLSNARRREGAARMAAGHLRRLLRSDDELIIILDPASLCVARYLVGTPRWGVHVHWSPDLILTPWRYLAGDGIPPFLLPIASARMRAVGRRNARLLKDAPFLVSLTPSHTRTLSRLQPSVHEIANPIASSTVAARRTARGADVVTIGYVGRLAWEKGPDLLVEALARLDASVGATRAVIAGSGPAEESVRRRTAELGLNGVEFLGWVDDPGEVLELVDVLVVPSRSEAMGLVIVEALAAGCRVVAADAGSGVRDVLRDGALGAVVPVDDYVALSSAIEQAVRDTREGRAPDPEMVADLIKSHAPSHVVDCWIAFLAQRLGSQV